MTRGIQRVAGLRQAHIAPALTEGLTPIIVAGDVREDPRTMLPESFAAVIEIVTDGTNVKRAVFANILTSDRVCVLRRLHVYGAIDWWANGAGNVVEYVYDLQPNTGTVWNISAKGQRLVNGYQSQVIGGAPPQVPGGLDISFPSPKPSCNGFHTPALNGIAGGYIWHGIMGNAAGPEILEDFNSTSGPRIIVFPGGTFESYAIDVNFHGYATHDLFSAFVPLHHIYSNNVARF